MSVDYFNNTGTTIIICDGNDCMEMLEHDGFDGHCDIKAASQEARKEGWKIFFDKDAADWVHYCSNCKGEYV